MKTWRLTTRKPGKLSSKQPAPETILVAADRLLVGKTGSLIFVRSDGEDSGWGPNPDDPFYHLDGFIVVHVAAAGTYASCVIMEHNHDR